MYQYIIDSTTKQNSTSIIKRISDNAYIPFDIKNRDYQEYLKWLSAGNTPLLA